MQIQIKILVQYLTQITWVHQARNRFKLITKIDLLRETSPKDQEQLEVHLVVLEEKLENRDYYFKQDHQASLPQRFKFLEDHIKFCQMVEFSL